MLAQAPSPAGHVFAVQCTELEMNPEAVGEEGTVRMGMYLLGDVIIISSS
jgi:hypothetical protein